MRNPERIYPFAMRIAAAWQKMPDQRFGQLVSNFFRWLDGQQKSYFYIEDDELIELFEAYVAIFTEY